MEHRRPFHHNCHARLSAQRHGVGYERMFIHCTLAVDLNRYWFVHYSFVDHCSVVSCRSVCNQHFVHKKMHSVSAKNLHKMKRLLLSIQTALSVFSCEIILHSYGFGETLAITVTLSQRSADYQTLLFGQIRTVVTMIWRSWIITESCNFQKRTKFFKE